MAVGADLGVAKLARMATLHFAAQLLRHGLHAVADAEHWNAELKDGIGRTVRRLLVGAGVAA